MRIRHAPVGEQATATSDPVSPLEGRRDISKPADGGLATDRAAAPATETMLLARSRDIEIAAPPTCGASIVRAKKPDLIMATALVGASVAGLTGQQAAGWGAVAVAAGAGAMAGRIRPVGLLQLGAFGGASAALPLKPLADCGLAVLAAPFLLHVSPGFSPWYPFGPERLRAWGSTYLQTISPDKHIVGSMAWLRVAQTTRALSGADLGRMAATGGIAGLTVAALMGAGLATGFVAVDPRPPGLIRSVLWAADNLFVTCVAEEAIFRGLLQPGVAALCGSGPIATGIAVCITSVAFGLAHHRGGSTYIALSAIAGAGYGAAAAVLGRVTGGIAAHFALNATHFFAFTYPAIDPRRGKKRAAQAEGCAAAHGAQGDSRS